MTEINYEEIAKMYGVELDEESKAQIDRVLKPDNLIRLYFYAAVKVLGTNNVLTFEIPEELELPKDGVAQFGVNQIGKTAIITVIEGEENIALINNKPEGEGSPEPTDVREVGVGQDPHSIDLSKPSTGGHGGGLANSTE